MTTDEAINFYGGARHLAVALDITTQAVHQWGERPPRSRQIEIELATSGKLRADAPAVAVARDE